MISKVLFPIFEPLRTVVLLEFWKIDELIFILNKEVPKPEVLVFVFRISLSIFCFWRVFSICRLWSFLFWIISGFCSWWKSPLCIDRERLKSCWRHKWKWPWSNNNSLERVRSWNWHTWSLERSPSLSQILIPHWFAGIIDKSLHRTSLNQNK